MPAFQIDAFEEDAFDVEESTLTEDSAPVSYGGYWTREFRDVISGRVRRRRKLPDDDEITDIIQSVAAEQALRLEKDEQKRFEELERELELRGVEWEARYLETLNQRREFLIDQEIERLLRQKLENDNRILLILMALI